MDRQTRKANFKKLQQPTTKSTKLRSTHSKTATSTLTLSNYFDAPEEVSTEQLPPTHHTTKPNFKENEHLAVEPKVKKPRESDDFEKDDVKPKRAPKLKTSSSKPRRGRSKQPSISAFLRNEQLFSEVTAQHCMADNFSPDDIEMALALSKSEAEKNGRLRLNETEDEVVNLIYENEDHTNENIRLKLQRYGFRTANKEDYNTLSTAIMSVGKRGKNAKWANKFTPLTLRNPELQQIKLQKSIAAIIDQQVKTIVPNAEELLMPPYELISKRLRRLKAAIGNLITHEPSEAPMTNLASYYVPHLFEVDKTNVDHLLKNWSAIQGRDLSPERQTKQNHVQRQRLQKAYDELEAVFNVRPRKDLIVPDLQNIQKETISVEQDQREKAKELDELEQLLIENMIQDDSTACDMQTAVPSTCNSPSKEPPDKRAKLSDIQRQASSASVQSILTVSTQVTRSTSPDIFANSDEEDDAMTMTSTEPAEMANFSLKVYKDNSIEQKEPSLNISSYEIYSSDEVKTVTVDTPKNIKNNDIFEDIFIDLTDDNSAENAPINNANKTIKVNVSMDKGLYNLSPTFEAQTKADLSMDSISFKSSPSGDNMVLALGKGPDNNNLRFTPTSSTNSFNNPSLFDEPPVRTSGSSFNANTSTKFQKNISFTQSPIAANQFKVDYSLRSPLLERKSNSFSNQAPSVNGSPFLHSDMSIEIDLTQNSSDDDNDENDGVLLSDDEINYSIWKANKTLNAKATANEDDDTASTDSSFLYDEPKLKSQRPSISHFNSVADSDVYLKASPMKIPKSDSSPMPQQRKLPHFKSVAELDDFLKTTPMKFNANDSCSSHSPNKSALSKARAEFGILDAALSQPFTLSQLESPAKVKSPAEEINWAEASFLDTATEVPLKRLSTSNHDKFNELLAQAMPPADAEPDDFDEFDRLVFQNSSHSTDNKKSMPSGLDRLLNGEINIEPLPQPETPVKQQLPLEASSVPEQLEINGNLYNIRVCHTPKPDFTKLSEAEMFKQLYNYGLKPLKRKHAVKMLEFIYNQTHPIMMETEPAPIQPTCSKESSLPRSKSTPVSGSSSVSDKLQPMASIDCLTRTESKPNCKLQFRDAFGDELLRFSQLQPPALCDDFEHYVLQTNVSKKTPLPLVPLHIAWHNLLCANPELHQSLLMYEPIDLQEIYLYLKQLGHRYDPKDLKSFFDRRCIIFRYELAPPAKQIQRHVRKKPRKANAKF